jgi:hypothetical protein
MTDLNALFAPENKFVVPVEVSISPADQLKLHKFLNLHYLGDGDANELVDGMFVAKYPEKETEEFKNAVWSVSVPRTMYISVEFDVNGVPTFEIVKND